MSGHLEPPHVFESLERWERFEESLSRDPNDFQAVLLRKRALAVIARKRSGEPMQGIEVPEWATFS